MKIIIYLLLLMFYSVRSDRIKIHTTSPEKGRDYNYFPLKTDYLEFNVKTTRDANILLSNQYSLDGPYYEIIIGGNYNTLSVIKKNQTTNYAATHKAVLIKPNTFQKFWVFMNNTEESISVGKSAEKPFLYLQDPDYVKMSIFAVSSGWGSDAYWDFDYKC